MGDKPKDFVGSSEWIGAIEVSMCVNFFTNDTIDCRVVNVSEGSLLVSKAAELRSHFLTHGTPVMIGGDVKAHTILGVEIRHGVDLEIDDLSSMTEAPVMFLILDPHYKGQDSNLKTIISKGWCQWKDPRKFFNQYTFYNMCMPMLPL